MLVQLHKQQCVLHLKSFLWNFIVATKCLADSSLQDGNKDFLRVETVRSEQDGSTQIQIYGSTGVAASLGLHIYLKEYCNSHVSWEFAQIGN